MKRKKKFSYKGIVVGLAALIVLVAIGLTNTRSGFFVRTGQHDIDFNDISGDFDSSLTTALFEGQSIALTQTDQDSQAPIDVLGESSSREKRIEVDLTNQRLYAYEGDKKVFDFVISTGKPWWATPTGEFRPWIKLRYTRMRGGSKTLGTYYDLPNVPFVMFFGNDKIPGWKGYAIHGTYWHNNFGHPMSHGCVNLKTPDAEKLYYWATPDLEGHSSMKVTNHNPGTKIIIYGKTPIN